MFCHQCGKELHENARFCYHCGALIREASQRPDPTDAKEPDPLSADPSSITEESAAEQQVPEEPASHKTPEAELPADLILKKGQIAVSGSELRFNTKHYFRKPGRKKFRKEKRPVTFPVDSILHTSIEQHKYGGRIFLSLLLLICFAAGFLLSARYGYGAYNEWSTPYRDQELAALESLMAVIDNGADQLLQYRETRNENRADADALSADLSELKAQQAKEILEAVYNSHRFDLDDFFNRDFFFHAYQDYLQDLLNAFKSDELLDSWLYSYYVTTKEYGGNDFLDMDLWIYHGSGGNKFSSVLDSAAGLMSEQYDLDLYEHMLYTGRIYITGADFMREILSLPRYIMDGAVFAKAFGGAPNTAEMYVPGWSTSAYEEFWLYSANYYGIDIPMWLSQGFRAEHFNLDWNALVDEAAFYDAYRNFMDKIAPGLPFYEMASYHADNMAYGGMGYHLKGQEATFSDIFAAYAENHPEFIDELMDNKNYSRILATSVDEEIAEAETRLEQLEKEFLDLQDQERELTQLLEDADIYRGHYSRLLTDIEKHTQRLTNFLMFISGTALLSAFAALICLCKFFSFLKRPRHLFIINRRDMEYAFNIRHFPREQITALQNRLSPGAPAPSNQFNATINTSNETECISIPEMNQAGEN